MIAHLAGASVSYGHISSLVMNIFGHQNLSCGTWYVLYRFETSFKTCNLSVDLGKVLQCSGVPLRPLLLYFSGCVQTTASHEVILTIITLMCSMILTRMHGNISDWYVSQ